MDNSSEGDNSQTRRGNYDMVKWPLMLSISSRGIGFNVAMTVYQGVSQSQTLWTPDIYALYRVSLAAFEAKLRRVKEACPTICRYMEHVAYLKVDPKFESVNDVTYLPVFPADKVDSKGHFIPRAENVIYSNLRRTVVALASPETPLPYRIIFEQDNAIPGAIWSDHVLLNADEIIPEAHSADDLDRDYRDITPWLHTLQTLAPKLFSGNLTLDTTGNKAMFLCNSQNGLRIPPRNGDEDIEVYARRMMPIGNIASFFYSPVELVAKEQFEGIACLLGERTRYKDLLLPLGVLRLEAACSFVIDRLDYRLATEWSYRLSS
ncbi:uncharacterized protein LOC128262145 isoform X2 [Drosophila gunungcola]|uniref:uncharacterized protein LOC128262145 isoform X2 n=1 Tax=Drosophila gunungcola TaxID=103775 RepID=UPI0022E0B4D6|nr:uncharacterized protein LOC128262145 isoform X2 [Drosophila gunungcola]